MTKPALFLGIDGGGTKTEAVVVDQHGTVIGRGVAAGSNPHNIQPQIVIQNIQTAIKHTNIPVSKFQSACLGIAGLNTSSDRDDFTKRLLPHLNAHTVQVYNDGLIGFRSGSDAQEGMCLIASTGSNCFGLRADGSYVSAGDWGYLLGDQGSGFHLGQMLLQQAIKEYDGRQPRTALLSRVFTHFQVDTIANLQQCVYADKPPVDSIAGLAQIISEPEFSHHPFVATAAQQTVDSLFEAFQAVSRQLDSTATSSLPVVLVGKLFRATTQITQPLTEKIHSLLPQCHIILPTISPAEAAAKIALTG